MATKIQRQRSGTRSATDKTNDAPGQVAVDCGSVAAALPTLSTSEANELELRWREACYLFARGDDSRLVELLRTDEAIRLPDGARYLVSGLIEGSVPRPRGRPRVRAPGVNREIAKEVEDERLRQSTKRNVANPLERAIELVRRQRKLEVAQVRRIYEKEKGSV